MFPQICFMPQGINRKLPLCVHSYRVCERDEQRTTTATLHLLIHESDTQNIRWFLVRISTLLSSDCQWNAARDRATKDQYNIRIHFALLQHKFAKTKELYMKHSLYHDFIFAKQYEQKGNILDERFKAVILTKFYI